MPTYQYACTECGERAEAVQKFTDDPLTICPACGGKLRKVFSAVGIVFKGSGFYRNDSRKAPAETGAANGKADSSSSASSSESGSGAESGGKAEKSPAADKAPATAKKSESAGAGATSSSSGSSASGSSGSESSGSGSGSSGTGSSGTKVA